MATELVDERTSRVSHSVFLGVVWALTGTSFLFVLFRLYVQISSFRRLFIDDFLVILAWIIILSTAIIWQIENKALYELYAITAGTEPFNLDFLPRYNQFMRLLAPLQILFYSSLWCIKFSFLVFFYRLSSKIKAFRIWWFVVCFCTAAVYIASVGDIEYKCSFEGIEYIIQECIKLEHIHYENRSFWANCAGDVITDLMILSIPIIILWNTHIPRRKKIMLLSIFSATIIIMIVAIIRVAVDNTYDKEINIAWLCFWSFVEVNTAIIASCVASLRQLIVTSQNQTSSGRAAYHDTTDPMLRGSKPGLSPKFSHSVAYAESPIEDDEMAQFPANMVHVQNDIEICTKVASRSEIGGKSATEANIS